MGWGMDVIGGVVEGAQDVGGAIVDGARNVASATVEGFESGVSWVQDQLTPDIRPEGTNGHRIYVWFHHGPGTGSLDNAVDGWRKVSEHHVAVADAVNSAMGKLRTSWEGQAGSAALDASRPLRDAADSSSKSALQAGDALAAQSFGFNETKKSVIDVPADPPMINPLAGGAGVVNYHDQARAYTADQQANQAILQTYGTQTGSTSGNVPRFDGSGDDTKRDGSDSSPKPVAPVSGGFQDPGGAATYSAGPGTYSAGPGSSSGGSGAGTSGDGGSGGSSRTGHGAGGPGENPAGTGSSWYDGDSGLPLGGGFEFGTSHGISGAGVAAGAAGLVAGGGAVLGGGVLGDNTGGRGGISGRGIAAFGSGTGTGTGGGRSGGVTPTTGSTGSAATSRAGAPMAAGAAGRGGEGEEDETHERPGWLTADESPDELFGTDERSVPPVLGVLPSEQDEGQ